MFAHPALALGLLLPLSSLSGQTTPSDAKIRQILIDRIDRDRQGVGMVVGVIDAKGRRIIVYGSLAEGDTRPLNGDTVFEIGSVMNPQDPMNNPFADYTVDQLYQFLSGYRLTRDIGSQYEYSNLGVGLLGTCWLCAPARATRTWFAHGLPNPWICPAPPSHFPP